MFSDNRCSSAPNANQLLPDVVSVIILCASPHHVREILMVADDLNMVSSGEYVFFNIKLSTRWVAKHNSGTSLTSLLHLCNRLLFPLAVSYASLVEVCSGRL